MDGVPRDAMHKAALTWRGAAITPIAAALTSPVAVDTIHSIDSCDEFKH